MFRVIPLSGLFLAFTTIAILGQTPAADPFEKYLTRASADAALVKLEPNALFEVCEKIATGEAALKSKYPLPLKGLLKVTLRTATMKRDTATLDRLIALAKSLNHDEIVLAATLAKSNRRSGNDNFMVALDQMPADEVSVVRGWMGQIYNATAMGSREDLEDMQKRLEANAQLDSRIVAELSKRVRTALTALPVQTDVEDKLVNDSRKNKKKETSKENKETEEPAKTEESKDEEPKKPAEKRTPPKNFTEAIAALADGPDALVDEGFEGKIDLAKLGKHFKNQDAMGLADVAVRMAKEEQILERKHQFIPSDMIFRAATAMAMLKDDEKTLAHIEKAILKIRGEKSDDYTRFQAQKQLALASRKGTKPVMVSLDDLLEPSSQIVQSSIQMIDEAIKTSDRNTLLALQSGLSQSNDLTSEQKKPILERLQLGLAKLPNTTDESLEILRQLGEASSRAEQKLPILNSGLLTFATSHANKTVGNGTSEAFYQMAIQFVTPKKPVGAKVQIQKQVSFKDALPGDIVRTKAVGRDGYEYAIVSKRLPGGTILTVYTQSLPRNVKTAVVSVTFIDTAKVKPLAIFRPTNETTFTR